MTTRTVFKTGRLYTEPHGQLIVAEWADGVIRFHDMSRGIPGTVAAPKEPSGWWELATVTMNGYDFGQYSHLGMHEIPKYPAEDEKIEVWRK